MYLSIRIKLIIAFFSIIATGYVTIVYLFSNYETKVLKRRAIEHLKTEAQYSAEYLQNHLNDLAKEVLFLSRLELMDDLIASDIDKRIAQILQKKRDDIGQNIGFFAFDTYGNIVAKASKLAFQPHLNVLLSKIKRDKREPYVIIYEKNLLFISPIDASFDTSQRIGWLILVQPLSELSVQLRRVKDVIAWIIPPKYLANSLKEIFNPPDDAILRQDYLYVTQSIGTPLNGWQLGYALKKEVAFETIKQVQEVLLFAFIVMLLLTSALTVMIDRRIIEPVRRLAETASKIIMTNDYGMRVDAQSKDEVGELAMSFNRLMEKTEEAFCAIEEQNRNHAQTLVGLMHFFGQMIQSETEEETIKRACRELKRLTSADRVRFISTMDGEKEGCIQLECSLQKDREPKRFGLICIEGAKETMAMESRFFEAAGRMISLQIERIELLQTTREALKSKTSFFSALSHELRTPLGSILSLTQYLMTSSHCNASAKETLGRIESSASHLLQIINDILMIAKAESGKLEPMFQVCDLATLTEESVEMLQPLAEAKGIELITKFEENSLMVETDPKLFRQVLINLLANAIKYTSEGYVKVILKRMEESIELIVEDTGIGIEPSELKAIFQEFYREYRVRGRENGSGLGLALSQKIAEVLKGELVIESEGRGCGTHAIFRLYVSHNQPLEPSQSTPVV
jgi:signal transduction histidine kinase